MKLGPTIAGAQQGSRTARKEMPIGSGFAVTAPIALGLWAIIITLVYFLLKDFQVI